MQEEICEEHGKKWRNGSKLDGNKHGWCSHFQEYGSGDFREYEITSVLRG